MMLVPTPTYAAHYGISRKHAWHLARHGKVPGVVNERGEWLIDINVKPPLLGGTQYTIRLNREEESAALQQAEESGLSIREWLKKVIKEAV